MAKAKRTDEILTEAAATWKARNAVYKDNYKHMGAVMKGFFPNGITLITVEDFIRFQLFVLVVTKLTRYTNNWKDGHQDSLRDAAVYTAMIEQVDGESLPQFEDARAEAIEVAVQAVLCRVDKRLKKGLKSNEEVLDIIRKFL